MDLQTELHHRLSEIGNHVDLAAAVAGSGPNAPDGLPSALHRLRELALQTKQRYLRSGREDELAVRLAVLEAAIDEACTLCCKRPAGHELPSATLDEARLEIRDLRRQIAADVRRGRGTSVADLQSPGCAIQEFKMTAVSQVMTRGVRAMSPDDTVRFAAQAMDELNIGAVPVCDGERLVGMVTDRDIAVRGVAKGRPVETTKLRDVMTPDVQWCYDDQSVEEVTERMREAQIRRMAVVDHEKHLVGMLSLGDVATKAGKEEASDALSGISQPSEPDRSSQSAASGAAGGGSSKGKPKAH